MNNSENGKSVDISRRAFLRGIVGAGAGIAEIATNQSTLAKAFTVWEAADVTPDTQTSPVIPDTSVIDASPNAKKEVKKTFDMECGINIFGDSNWNDWRKQSLDVLPLAKEVNATAVELTINMVIHSVHASEVGFDDRVPTVDNVRIFMETARDMGLNTTFRPTITEDELGGKWRGELHPDDIRAFFDSMATFIDTYAPMLEAAGVNEIVMGAELNSLFQEENLPLWHKLHDQIKSVAPHVDLRVDLNRGDYKPFMADVCDKRIGVDMFPKLDITHVHPTEDELIQAWQKEEVPFLQKIQADTQKELVFAEIGAVSLPNSWAFDDVAKSKYSVTDQATFHQASIKVAEKIGAKGYYIWGYSFNKPISEISDGEPDFDPFKPSEMPAIKDAFGRHNTPLASS